MSLLRKNTPGCTCCNPPTAFAYFVFYCVDPNGNETGAFLAFSTDLTITLDGSPFFHGTCDGGFDCGPGYSFHPTTSGTYVFTFTATLIETGDTSTQTTTVTWTTGTSFPTQFATFTYDGRPSCACFCIAPTTLTMTSRDETCNFDMFQSCTLTWQDTPSCMTPLSLPDQIYSSYPEGFPDPIGGGAIFYYLLTCQYSQFTLSRIYCVSPYGSPYHDGILYTWLLGGYENTCVPFALDFGSPFPGSDASCFVTIDG